MQPSNTLRRQNRAIKNSITAAKRFISTLQHVDAPNVEQQATLAAAHYTLALQHTISPPRSKLHFNSCIALLNNIPHYDRKQHPHWIALLAKAHVKRAELLEYEHEFASAMMDYQKSFDLFETLPKPLANSDKLQLAQCAISIADLAINLHDRKNNYQTACTSTDFISSKSIGSETPPHFRSPKTHTLHPLFYVNRALENLLELNHNSEEIWTTLSYAHQIAGIALIPLDIVEAVEALRTAVAMAFKATPKAACRLLGDIYNSIGLLYEHPPETPPKDQDPAPLNDYSTIYFAMGLLFSPSEPLPLEESHRLVDYLFDVIYRVLDPFMPPLSLMVMQDFIDALIFAYYSISDKSLPNEELSQHLVQPELFNSFAQHIYWLVIEHHRRCETNGRMLMWANPEEVDINPDMTDITSALLNPNSDENILYVDF